MVIVNIYILYKSLRIDDIHIVVYQFLHNFDLQDGEQYVLKVWTFEQIGNVLKVAGERKCREAQACLEGNIFILQDHGQAI